MGRRAALVKNKAQPTIEPLIGGLSATAESEVQTITSNSSGDEIANVNFLYDDIVHVLQNAIDSCINSATDRRGFVLERMCLPNSVK